MSDDESDDRGGETVDQWPPGEVTDSVSDSVGEPESTAGDSVGEPESTAGDSVGEPESTADGSTADLSDSETKSKPQTGADEQYCRSCGAVIKKQAEMCPKCGVRQKSRKRSSTGSSSDPEPPSSRLAAAGIGGVVALIGSLIPVLGQFLGGIVAGFLRGPDTRESTICGALAGLIASIPSALFFGFLLFLGIIGSAAGGDGLAAVVFLGFLLVTIIVIYAGLGAAGGFVGAMISDRSPPET